MKSESYYLFRVKTRRQAVKQSSGWKCFVYDFFNNLRFIGKGKYRKDAVGEAKEFEKGFAVEQEAERDKFRKRNESTSESPKEHFNKLADSDKLLTLERKERLKRKRREYRRTYYALHREECDAASRAWQSTHKEKIAATRKAYYFDHKPALLAAAKKYRDSLTQEQKGRIKASQARYMLKYSQSEAGKGKMREWHRNYYRRKHGIPLDAPLYWTPSPNPNLTKCN